MSMIICLRIFRRIQGDLYLLAVILLALVSLSHTTPVTVTSALIAVTFALVAVACLHRQNHFNVGWYILSFFLVFVLLLCFD